MAQRRPDLVAVLKKISEVRRASDARAMATEALEQQAKWQKRQDLLSRLGALPSSRPLVSQRRGDESVAAAEKRLYREAMGE